MRAGALSDPEVGTYLSRHFRSVWRKVGTFTAVRQGGRTALRVDGSIAVYFCTPDLEVVHAIAGPVDRDTFLREARWAVDAYAAACEAAKGDRGVLSAFLTKAHQASRSPWSVGCGTGGACISGNFHPCVGVVWNHNEPPVAHDRLLRTILATPAWAGFSISLPQDMHAYLAARGLPTLESIWRDVFTSMLGQPVSDDPVNVVDLSFFASDCTFGGPILVTNVALDPPPSVEVR